MIKTIKISTKNDNVGFSVVKSYLIRNCEAWVEGLNIFVPLDNALSYFKDKEHFMGFAIHTADSPVKIKGVYKDLNQHSSLVYAERIFGKEAV